MRIQNEKGLTLIEILISVSILAFISSFTAESISNAIRSKKRHTLAVEGVSLVRDALNIIQRDVNRAFHYRNIQVELYNEAKAASLEPAKSTTAPVNPKKTNPLPPTNPSAPPTKPAFEPKTYTVLTHFIGDKQKINFASLSNVQTNLLIKTSNQAEIGYELKPCKSVFNKSKSSPCLWRRISSIIDDRPEEGGRSSVLVENVDHFEISYYKLSTEEWVNSWDSKESLDPTIKAHFPSAVKITLSIKLPKGSGDKLYSMTMMAKIRFPNNPPEKKEISTEATL